MKIEGVGFTNHDDWQYNIAIGGTLELIGGIKELSQRTINNAGTATWTNTANANGRIRTGSGVTISNSGLWQDQSAFDNQISNDFAGSQSGFSNLVGGTFTKSGGTAMTTISIVFSNSGTVNVQTGTLALSGTVIQYPASTLTGGTWTVLNGATLSIPGPASNIQTNNADVTLSGAASVFARINALTTNNGAFRLLANRSFTATGAFTNAGVLQLGGGTFGAPGLTNSAAGQVFGFGTISLRPVNSGLIRSAGGTLTLSNGIQGGSGTVQVDAGSTLNLSGGASGSSGDFLMHNGTAAGSLNLGPNSFTVGVDYTNGSFGTGNTFDPRANVAGTGQILMSSALAQQLVGNVTGGTGATPVMAFDNVHVGGATTRFYQINNVGASGPSLRGAIQTAVNGGNVTDARLSGTGVTAAIFGPIAPGSNSGDRAITFTATSAGALTGQTVRLLNNFDNVGDQLLSITGAAYRFASASHTPEPVSFGNFHVGDPAPTQFLSVTNNVAEDGFSEALDVSGGSPTGGVTTNAGSFSLLAAGATNGASLVVGIDTSSAGSKNATATIGLTSNGSGSSALGATALAAQTVNVTGFVYSGLGVWNTNGSGAWNATGNWQSLGGVPGLDAGFTATDTATFGSAATSANATVSLEGVSPSLEAITFDNPTRGYTLAKGTGNGLLKLDNGGSTASVTDSNGNHTVSAPIELHSDVAVAVAVGGSLSVSGGISETGGAKTLTKFGGGTLTLTGSQNYTTLTTGGGITNLQAALGTGSSTLNANARTNLSTSQTLAALNIGEGGGVVLTASGAAPAGSGFRDDDFASGFVGESDMSFASAGVGASPQAVPEPGGAALLFAGTVAIFGRRRRAARTS